MEVPTLTGGPHPVGEFVVERVVSAWRPVFPEICDGPIHQRSLGILSVGKLVMLH